jgi:hypothetical protein
MILKVADSCQFIPTGEEQTMSRAASKIKRIVGTRKVAVVFESDAVAIHIEGYGNFHQPRGGEIIVLDMSSITPQLLVWADINREDTSHGIGLAGAETARNKVQDG